MIVFSNQSINKVSSFILLLGILFFSSCKKDKVSSQILSPQNYAKIQGHILNSQLDEVTVIQNYRPMGISLFEVIELDSLGKFTYEIKDITTSIDVRVKVDDTNIFTLYIAPGYDIHFVCDGSALEIRKTLQFSGTGAEPNEFLQTIWSHPALKKYPLNNQDKYSSEEFFKRVNNHFALKDSILKSTFMYEGAPDIFKDFYHYQKINHKFRQNIILLYFAINKDLDKKELLQFFETFIEKDVLDLTKYDNHYF